MDDNERLRDALQTIQDTVPEARLVHLETSDQATYGFVLTDVTLTNGERLSVVDEDLLDRVTDAVWSPLSNIDWDGAVGEDAMGYAVFSLEGRGGE